MRNCAPVTTHTHIFRMDRFRILLERRQLESKACDGIRAIFSSMLTRITVRECSARVPGTRADIAQVNRRSVVWGVSVPITRGTV